MQNFRELPAVEEARPCRGGGWPDACWTQGSHGSTAVIANVTRAPSVSAYALVFKQDERGPGEELLQFEAISQLPAEEQAVVMEVLESLIIKYKTRH